MTRGPQPGHAVISGGKSYHITSSGDYVPFDSQRHRDARPWARGSRQDTREQVL